MTLRLACRLLTLLLLGLVLLWVLVARADSAPGLDLLVASA